MNNFQEFELTKTERLHTIGQGKPERAGQDKIKLDYNKTPKGSIRIDDVDEVIDLG